MERCHPTMHAPMQGIQKKTNAFSLENLSFNTQRSTLTCTCSDWGFWIYFNHEIHPKQRVKKKQSKIKCSRHKTHMWSSIHRFLLVDNWICFFTLRFSQVGWNKTLMWKKMDSSYLSPQVEGLTILTGARSSTHKIITQMKRLHAYENSWIVMRMDVTGRSHPIEDG